MDTQFKNIGYIPCPPSESNRECASLFSGQLLAYGAAAAVAVVDVRDHHFLETYMIGLNQYLAYSNLLQVQRLGVATSLVGGHPNASVTAVEWYETIA